METSKRHNKTKKPDTINIKSKRVDEHISAFKFLNDDWKTIAFSFPRNDIKTRFIDRELRYNAIYFLFGYKDDGTEEVYVGQASKRANGESVFNRLREHDDSNTESYRNRWSAVVVVTNQDDTWGPTELNALESIFISEIPYENSLNGRKQNNAGADLNIYDDKVNQIKALVTAIGFKIFEDIPETENKQTTSVTNDCSVLEDLHNGMARIPEIITPNGVVKAMVDMLPADVWNSHTTFLDLACKGGEYLREIYDRLMNNEAIQSEFPDTEERSIHILKNQIYGIALSQVSLSRTAKKLKGDDRNLRIIPNYIDILRGRFTERKPDGTLKTFQDVLNEEFNKDMKFDVVLGNPPYQETTGGGKNGKAAKPLYTHFLSMAHSFHPSNLIMITPNRWLRGNTTEMVELRENILNGDIACIKTFSNSWDVFPNIGNIAGGVGYVLLTPYRERQTTVLINNVHGKEIRENTVYTKDDKILCTDAMGKRILDKVDFSNSLKLLVNKTNVFNIETNAIGDESLECDYCNVYTSRGIIKKKREHFDSCKTLMENYKVLTSKCAPSGGFADATGKFKVLSQSRVILPYECCSQSYIVLGPIESEDEASSLSDYLKLKFVRFLIHLSMSGLSITDNTFRYVPMQDFSDTYTDKQLYKKYNLNYDEINYIENTIKEFE